jgi:hypothetical protein
MTGVLSSKLKEMIALAGNTSEDNLYLKIRDNFKYKNKLTEEVIETYVNALIYEPTNATPVGICKFEAPVAYFLGRRRHFLHISRSSQLTILLRRSTL